MADLVIGLLHPGEMGSAVGAAARSAGGRVLWSSEGRTPETRNRAAAAGLEDAGSFDAMVARSQVILSVCPPHAAEEVARRVAAARFKGLYVDANAVSPVTAISIGCVVESAGADFVDGGIIGLPPVERGKTRLYLSGRRACEAAALFKGSSLEAIVLEGKVGAASALKIAFASWTKVSAALLLTVRGFAAAEGVDAALLEEWRRSMPELPARAEMMTGNARKAWRFIGEMEEIASAFDAAGLPDGFALAAREVYQRLEPYKDRPAPSVEEVAAAIRSNLDATHPETIS
jgi:3-hydroxyisobutyrate dehydrogenase-like beta-hydroxyacid dehydrogenase